MQLNNAKKTVWKHDRHTAGMQAPQRAAAMQATAGATLTMECMHGGAERHAALKPDKEWCTPDTKANKDSPLDGPHYLKSTWSVGRRGAGGAAMAATLYRRTASCRPTSTGGSACLHLMTG